MNARGRTVRVARAKKPLAGFEFRFERLRLTGRCGRALAFCESPSRKILFEHSLLRYPHPIADRTIRQPANLIGRPCNRVIEQTVGFVSTIFHKSKTQTIAKAI